MSLDAQALRNVMDEVYRNADAEWPTSEGRVTAERLIRFWLLRAQLSVGMQDGFPSSSRRWSDAIRQMVDAFGFAMLLQRVRDSYPVAAEFLAKQLWSDLEDGEQVPGLMYQWLQERNLQPEAIRLVGERMAREQLPPAESAELRRAVAAIQELRDSFEDAGRPAPDVVDAQWLLEVMATAAEVDHPATDTEDGECARPDCVQIASTASVVYCDITGGLLSYPTYDARTILAHASDEVNKLVESETVELRAEVARYRAALQGLAEHGLRCDLSPTMMFDGTENGLYAQWVRYLGRVDAAVRERAAAALGGGA